MTNPRKGRKVAIVLVPGARVMIGKPHPWQGHSGILRREFTTPLGDKLWQVDLDNGCCAGVKTENLQPW